MHKVLLINFSMYNEFTAPLKRGSFCFTKKVNGDKIKRVFRNQYTEECL